MFVITRCLAKQLKSVLRLALDLTGRSNLPTIQLHAGPHGLRVRCSNGHAFAEFQLDGEQPNATVCVPFDLLAEVEGGSQTPVEIQSQDGNVTASWRAGDVPQFVQHQMPDISADEWPRLPEHLTENLPQLLTALRDATQTTEPESSRYALGSIQLDGESGVIVATDGRQALVQSGFSFPWENKLLVPGSKVFGSNHLPTDQPVLTGRAENWIVFRVRPWTFWFPLNLEGRYPDVVSQICQPEQAIASCAIGEADCKFLLDNLPRLPSNDHPNQPLTVDLNGHIAVRGQHGDSPTCTELLLNASTRSGDPIRINTNRRFIHRAVQLGFNQVHLFSDSSPALACDERRQYVWALLDPKSAIAPDENAVRIESTKVSPTNRITKTPTRKLKIMPEFIPSTDDHNRQNKSNELTGESLAVLIEKGEVLKAHLRDSLRSASELVAGLKNHRKKTKRMRSTLRSLRQLQAIDA